MNYVQVSYTILESTETENREYRPLESIRDNYPEYAAATDYMLQKRNGIRHINLIEFMMSGSRF